MLVGSLHICFAATGRQSRHSHKLFYHTWLVSGYATSFGSAYTVFTDW